MSKRLTNKDFTIIANDCFGTFVYHNLSQRFNSPTINLFFSQSDFILFASNLKGYLDAELEEVVGHDRRYPLGALTFENKTIHIEFMHYHSFDEAKNKWDQRKKRVNYSNIYLIQTIPGEITQKNIDDFKALPYSNKLLVTRPNDFECDGMVTHPVFVAPKYYAGKILQHKSWVSLTRFMDDIDYISFINNI